MASSEKNKKESINSGQFMVSDVHDRIEGKRKRKLTESTGTSASPVSLSDIEDDSEPLVQVLPDKSAEKPITFFKFGATSSRSLTIDASLSKLCNCFKQAYNKMTTPKWKKFSGMKLEWKDRIRLNNVIWRQWQMQFRLNVKPKHCFFAVPDENHSTHDSAVVIEGMYWKRRQETVAAEYSRWRHFFWNQCRKQKGGSRQGMNYDQENGIYCSLRPQPDNCNEALFLPFPVNLSPMSQLDEGDDFSNAFADTLFQSLSQPYMFPNPKEMAQSRNADFIQPGLVQLQPSVEEIMASLDYTAFDDMDTGPMSSASQSVSSAIRESMDDSLMSGDKLSYDWKSDLCQLGSEEPDDVMTDGGSGNNGLATLYGGGKRVYSAQGTTTDQYGLYEDSLPDAGDGAVPHSLTSHIGATPIRHASGGHHYSDLQSSNGVEHLSGPQQSPSGASQGRRYSGGHISVGGDNHLEGNNRGSSMNQNQHQHNQMTMNNGNFQDVRNNNISSSPTSSMISGNNAAATFVHGNRQFSHGKFMTSQNNNSAATGGNESLQQSQQNPHRNHQPPHHGHGHQSVCYKICCNGDRGVLVDSLVGPTDRVTSGGVARGRQLITNHGQDQRQPPDQEGDYNNGCVYTRQSSGSNKTASVSLESVGNSSQVGPGRDCGLAAVSSTSAQSVNSSGDIRQSHYLPDACQSRPSYRPTANYNISGYNDSPDAEAHSSDRSETIFPDGRVMTSLSSVYQETQNDVVDQSAIRQGYYTKRHSFSGDNDSLALLASAATTITPPFVFDMVELVGGQSTPIGGYRIVDGHVTKVEGVTTGLNVRGVQHQKYSPTIARPTPQMAQLSLPQQGFQSQNSPEIGSSGAQLVTHVELNAHQTIESMNFNPNELGYRKHQNEHEKQPVSHRSDIVGSFSGSGGPLGLSAINVFENNHVAVGAAGNCGKMSAFVRHVQQQEQLQQVQHSPTRHRGNILDSHASNVAPAVLQSAAGGMFVTREEQRTNTHEQGEYTVLANVAPQQIIFNPTPYKKRETIRDGNIILEPERKLGNSIYDGDRNVVRCAQPNAAPNCRMEIFDQADHSSMSKSSNYCEADQPAALAAPSAALGLIFSAPLGAPTPVAAGGNHIRHFRPPNLVGEQTTLLPLVGGQSNISISEQNKTHFTSKYSDPIRGTLSGLEGLSVASALSSGFSNIGASGFLGSPPGAVIHPSLTTTSALQSSSPASNLISPLFFQSQNNPSPFHHLSVPISSSALRAALVQSVTAKREGSDAGTPLQNSVANQLTNLLTQGSIAESLYSTAEQNAILTRAELAARSLGLPFVSSAGLIPNSSAFAIPAAMIAHPSNGGLSTSGFPTVERGKIANPPISLPLPLEFQRMMKSDIGRRSDGTNGSIQEVISSSPILRDVKPLIHARPRLQPSFLNPPDSKFSDHCDSAIETLMKSPASLHWRSTLATSADPNPMLSVGEFQYSHALGLPPCSTTAVNHGGNLTEQWKRKLDPQSHHPHPQFLQLESTITSTISSVAFCTPNSATTTLPASTNYYSVSGLPTTTPVSTPAQQLVVPHQQLIGAAAAALAPGVVSHAMFIVENINGKPVLSLYQPPPPPLTVAPAPVPTVQYVTSAAFDEMGKFPRYQLTGTSSANNSAPPGSWEKSNLHPANLCENVNDASSTTSFRSPTSLPSSDDHRLSGSQQVFQHLVPPASLTLGAENCGKLNGKLFGETACPKVCQESKTLQMSVAKMETPVPVLPAAKNEPLKGLAVNSEPPNSCSSFKQEKGQSAMAVPLTAAPHTCVSSTPSPTPLSVASSPAGSVSIPLADSGGSSPAYGSNNQNMKLDPGGSLYAGPSTSSGRVGLEGDSLKGSSMLLGAKSKLIGGIRNCEGGVSMDTMLMRANSKKRAADSSTANLDPLERKRVAHVNSEHHRRCALKDGFERLKTVVPGLRDVEGKMTNAMVLMRGADYLERLKSSTQNLDAELVAEKEKMDHLKTKIDLLQAHLASAGSSRTPRHATVAEFYRDYATSRTREDWRFWLLSKTTKPLLESYCGQVKGSNSSELTTAMARWGKERCNVAGLRPLASQLLMELASIPNVLETTDVLAREAEKFVTER